MYLIDACHIRIEPGGEPRQWRIHPEDAPSLPWGGMANRVMGKGSSIDRVVREMIRTGLLRDHSRVVHSGKRVYVLVPASVHHENLGRPLCLPNSRSGYDDTPRILRYRLSRGAAVDCLACKVILSVTSADGL